MRSDFDKVMFDYESRQPYKQFKHTRRQKKFQGDEVGGREGMKTRYDAYGDQRKFHYPNTDMIKRWLTSKLGQNWNKCYSEFCQTVNRQCSSIL